MTRNTSKPPFEWRLRAINELNRMAETPYLVTPAWLRELASYISEHDAIDRYDDWVMWNASGPCPFDTTTLVDLKLFDGRVHRNIMVSSTTNMTPYGAAKLWMSTGPSGVYAYRLAKGD